MKYPLFFQSIFLDRETWCLHLKVLLHRSRTVKGMGIPEVGVADKKLIASMKSSFSKRLNFDRGPSESMVKAMESGNTTELTRSIGKRMLDRTENETCYASEERVPLY